ncbi:hypothetical protein EUTSA_v10002115mg [Eutrema salsugineum]|uniref:Uncharacterized protein n=1 Tax=Eutrema salsugineum TaxID=72664 RepID=V4NU79_EUTSA|nr:hypothetical protein EUTSA_v10002115mg [Eutrema salsugineum]
MEEDGKQNQGRIERRSGDRNSRFTRPSGYVPPKELQKRYVPAVDTVEWLEKSVMRKEAVEIYPTNAVISAVEGDTVGYQGRDLLETNDGIRKSARKTLSFDDGGDVLANLVQDMELDSKTGEQSHTVEEKIDQGEPEDGELFEDTLD